MSTPSTNAEVKCREVVELVTGYLERRLDDGERHRLEAHLDACTGCEAYVEQMRLTIAGLRGLGEPPAAPAGFDELLAAFRAHQVV